MFTDPARRICCVIGTAVCCLVLFSPCWVQGQVVIDFEDEDFDQWVVVDEPPENLGEQGPSTWEIRESQNDIGANLTGMVLYQGSNIWGEPEDHMLTGTIIYFADQQFTNFTLEMDVIANDNDGMGPVWGFTDLDQHYRIQMINDRWPEVPALDGHNGPMLIAHTRISNETPWYELIEVVDGPDYIPYPAGW